VVGNSEVIHPRLYGLVMGSWHVITNHSSPIPKAPIPAVITVDESGSLLSSSL